MTTRVTKFIETKLPLWWLIATGGAVVYTMGTTVANFNTVQENLKNIESKMESVDSRVQLISTQLIRLEGANETQDLRLNYLQNELRGSIIRTPISGEHE